MGNEQLVRQRVFGNLLRVIGRLCRPHPETAAESMDGDAIAIGIHPDALVVESGITSALAFLLAQYGCYNITTLSSFAVTTECFRCP